MHCIRLTYINFKLVSCVIDGLEMGEQKLCCTRVQRTNLRNIKWHKELSENIASAHQVPFLYLPVVRLFFTEKERCYQLDYGAVFQNRDALENDTLRHVILWFLEMYNFMRLNILIARISLHLSRFPYVVTRIHVIWVKWNILSSLLYHYTLLRASCTSSYYL